MVRSSIIKRDRVTLSHVKLHVGPGAAQPSSLETGRSASHATHGEASVRVKRKNDRIESIEVVCPCGNEIVLECVHTEPSPIALSRKDAPPAQDPPT